MLCRSVMVELTGVPYTGIILTALPALFYSSVG